MIQADALDAALIALGRGDELDAWRAIVVEALAKAQRDHDGLHALRLRSAPLRRLARVQRLADAASSGDSGALATLAADIGDGVEIDRLLDDLMGYADVANGVDPHHRVARHFASAHVLDKAVRAKNLYFFAFDVLRFSTPRSRRKRGPKFFAVLALAFVWIDLTGEIPQRGSAWATDSALEGPFVDFVVSVDASLPFGDGETSFDRAIRDALAVGSAELENYHLAVDKGELESQHARRISPPHFGSPSFTVVEEG